VQILTVPENALLKQHKALLETENVSVEFTGDAVNEIARIAFLSNEQSENIGARRLHTVMEKLLEDVAFDLPNPEQTEIKIDAEYVKDKFMDRILADDVDRFIL
jgi:ATP-dependent HslUV protease ATP-binding subunit HslU